ncbi:hypothetical protein N6H14_12600 [Paenibacillus sp. CC-CFT747]|nr:hypothetical protein N6H14_12600 [Paenibacillus sp. CC-CFT747]
MMASHNMDEVRRLADYVVFLDGGRAYGPFEKDALLTDWKRLWTEELPEEVCAGLPGTVLLEEEPMRIVTDDLGAVQAYLAQKGRQVFRSQALELEEIMGFLTGRTEAASRRSKEEKRA